MKNPGREGDGISQTKELFAKHEGVLCRLPNEILLAIIEHFLDNWSEAEDNHDKKIKQTVPLVSGEKTTLWIYQHNPDFPISTSFQSFSVVNRRIYSLCRPFLWEYLTFPSPLQSRMSFWRKDILPKHGSYVKTVYAKLREQWFERLPKPLSIERAIRDRDQHQPSSRSDLEEDNELRIVDDVRSDNLGVSYMQSRGPHTLLGLCPENLIQVLSHCENLTALHLKCLHGGQKYPDPEEMHHFRNNLTSLFSELGHLQHLKILGPESLSIRSECIYKPIIHLPLLESLEFSSVAVEAREEVGRLAACLYNLKNLKRLVMDEVDALDNSWGFREGPPHLENLTIRYCTHLRLAKTPSFVSSWAPHLTHLELRFVEPFDILSQEDLSDFDPRDNLFSLPSLTHLTIWPHSGCHYVHCFSDCKELRQLTFNYWIRCEPDEEDPEEEPDDSHKGLSELSDFITGNSFPKLKSIVLPTEHDNFPLDPISASAMAPLEEFCKSNGIELKMFPDNVLYESLRVRDYRSVIVDWN